MNSKEYTLPNGKKAVFEYDVCGIGKVTLECMDELMAMIADRPQGTWFKDDEGTFICSACGSGYKDQPTIMGKPMFEWCPICGARMKGADDE